MLIKFFKQSYLQQFLALLAIQLVLWGRYLIVPIPLNPDSKIHPLFGLLMDIIGNNPWAGVLVAFCLLSLSAILINVIMIRNELVPNNSLVPALIFISLLSQGPGLLTLYPELLSIVFVLLAVDRVMHCYGESEITVINNILTASLFVSLATLSYLPSLWFVLLIWISMFIFRQLSLRIWAISIIGLSLPVLYFAAYNYLTDKPMQIYHALLAYYKEIFPLSIDYSDPTYIIWGIITVVLILSIFYSLIHMNEWNVNIRRKIIVVFWIIIVSLPISMYGHLDFLANQTFQLIPATMLISGYISALKIRRWQELVFFLFLLLVLFNNHMY